MSKLRQMLDQILDRPRDPDFEIIEQAQLDHVRTCIQDVKWKQWIKTPEAMVEILRDPRLLTKPSDQIQELRATDILKMIRSRTKPGKPQVKRK
jgi:hypothetical protein